MHLVYYIEQSITNRKVDTQPSVPRTISQLIVLLSLIGSGIFFPFYFSLFLIETSCLRAQNSVDFENTIYEIIWR